MKFCPKCNNIMVPRKDDKKVIMQCSCGYRLLSKRADKKDIVFKEKLDKQKTEIGVVEEKKIALPKIEAKCPKCENNEAYFWTMQTRGSDESETKFYKCTKCDHIWRDYD